jgi:two-component system, LytTR family, response regulator
MINTLLISEESPTLETLIGHLSSYCPQLEIGGIAASREEAQQLLEAVNPELVFMDMDIIMNAGASILEPYPGEFETIILHSSVNLNKESVVAEAIHYLFQPVQVKELLAVVAHAHHRIDLKREWKKCRQLLAQLHYQSPPNNLIGIPTMEGMEFLRVHEIVRCEGLHQFTRVVITEGPGIISSYNIGKFADLLLPYGFFAPHKSHLVNLQHLRKYTVEGTILMRDGSVAPVSRRRRGAFLERVRHL